MSMKKYVVPEFLSGRVDQDRYERWLKAKARAHSKGDVGRFGVRSSAEAYRDMPHAAVLSSSGKDCYTGEDLHWEKISTYNNDHSRAGKTAYKAGFALLPTADHVRKATGPSTSSSAAGGQTTPRAIYISKSCWSFASVSLCITDIGSRNRIAKKREHGLAGAGRPPPPPLRGPPPP
jgi:hypothetical protein